ncbi:hypothetical protein F7725_006973 [Dissostichus mawsoni]|uniref:HTH La-type RNA-binding domain-containing protein n=1 Tax=Dissostichus mawsoni TaxID=36200 RepID=A0A7J5XW27_DISMA|nr:hypothetical protein F7725_006973 [Dissostichus mawsoni]
MVSLRGGKRRRWEMATQVEALLPGNPLAKAEEHGKTIRGEPEEDEGGRGDGAKRQTGVAEQGSCSGGSSPGQGGTSEEQTSKEETEESKGGCDSEDKQNEEGVKGRKEFTEAPPPKVNPWTRKMNAVTVVSVNGRAHHESTGPAKVVRAGNPPKARRGGKVGDFGDATNWPTPGEIATKDMQIEAVTRTVSCPSCQAGQRLMEIHCKFHLQPAPKKPTTVKKESKESKEKRESNEESKENLKAKSDDSGEEKNGDDDSQKNGPKTKKGNKQKWVPLMIEVKSEGPRERSASRNNSRQNENPRLPPNARNDLRGHYDHHYGYKSYDMKDGSCGQKFGNTVTYYYDNMSSNDLFSVDHDHLKDYIKRQIEYYFSLDNLERDFFLRRKMDQEGFLPLSLVASFHRVQALTTDVNLILEALKGSQEVEIIDGKIRRKVDPEQWPLPGLAMLNQPQTDFSQLINCAEFIPRQMPDEPRGSPRSSTPVRKHSKTDLDTSNLKTMPKGLSASLPDLDSECWIEVKKRPRPSPARPKASAEKAPSLQQPKEKEDLVRCLLPQPGSSPSPPPQELSQSM